MIPQNKNEKMKELVTHVILTLIYQHNFQSLAPVLEVEELRYCHFKLEVCGPPSEEATSTINELWSFPFRTKIYSVLISP